MDLFIPYTSMLNKCSKTWTFMSKIHSLAAANTMPLFGLDRVITCLWVQTNCKSLFSPPQKLVAIMTQASGSISGSNFQRISLERFKVACVHRRLQSHLLRGAHKPSSQQSNWQYVPYNTCNWCQINCPTVTTCTNSRAPLLAELVGECKHDSSRSPAPRRTSVCLQS